jgi:hypothetical protein
MGCAPSASKDAIQIPQFAVLTMGERKKGIDEKAADYELGEYMPGFPPQCKKLPVHEEMTSNGVTKLTALFYGLVKEKVELRASRLKNTIIATDAEEAQPFFRMRALFEDDEVPPVAGTWKTDEEFGYIHLNGYMPQFVRIVSEIPATFKIVEAEIAPTLAKLAPGKSLAELIAEKRVYIMNHCQDLKDVVPVDGHVNVIPMCLFVVDDKKHFMPVAITLEDNGLVVYAHDDAGLWLGCKLHVMCAELNTFLISCHTLREHLVLELTWALFNQTVADQHPIYHLLKPHTWNTIFVNQGLRGSVFEESDITGIKGAIGMTLNGAHNGAIQVVKNSWTNLNWREYYDIPYRFEQEGVMDIPNYFVRDDYITLFKIVDDFVGDILTAAYQGKEELLKTDNEIQAWAKALEEKSGMKGLPVKNGKFETLADLRLMVTGILFQCAVRHGHIENTGPIYYPWVNLFPSSFSMPIPHNKEESVTEKQVDAWLPDDLRMLNQVALIESKRVKVEVDMIGQYPPEFMKGAPKAIEAAKKFQEALKNVETEFKAKASERKKAYPNVVEYNQLYPSRLAISIWN